MDYPKSGISLWTAIAWGFFNVIILGLTLCCKCCNRRKLFDEYCKVFKISAFSFLVATIVTFVSFLTLFFCDSFMVLFIFGSMVICGIVLFLSFLLIGQIRRIKTTKNGQKTRFNHLHLSQPLQQPLYETAYMQLLRQQQQYVTAYQPSQMMTPQILTAPLEMNTPSRLTTTEANCKSLRRWYLLAKSNVVFKLLSIKMNF
jgi:hypothetical protein